MLGLISLSFPNCNSIYYKILIYIFTFVSWFMPAQFKLPESKLPDTVNYVYKYFNIYVFFFYVIFVVGIVNGICYCIFILEVKFFF